jgi:hypothetical protein
MSHSVGADEAWTGGSPGNFGRKRESQTDADSETAPGNAPGWLASAACLMAASVALVFGRPELAMVAIAAGLGASLLRGRTGKGRW